MAGEDLTGEVTEASEGIERSEKCAMRRDENISDSNYDRRKH